jgi:hypothetical protein
MTASTNSNESMRELRSDEVDAVIGAFSFSVGFVTINQYGKDAEGGYGLGPNGTGVGLPQVWNAESARSRLEAF